jgi:hypothetical protein
MPRQPIGTTFVVAMSLLGLIAAIQVIAVLLRYADVAKQLLQERALAKEEASAAPAANPQATPFRPNQNVQAAQPSQPVNGQQVEQLLAEANRQFRIGDFEASLKTLEELEVMSPGDPSVLLIKAAVLEKIDQPAEAVLILEEVMRFPGLPPDQRAYAKKKIDMLSESLGGSPRTTPKSGGSLTTKELPDDGGDTMRGSSGIPAGATLGIIDIRSKDNKRGTKTFGVSLKSLPGAEINIEKVQIMAYFYEQTEDGETELTGSNIRTRWMSPPVNWAEDEPEILDLDYSEPETSENPGSENRKYVGYVVGLYYNDELQDFRSDPPSLLKKFPLPLSAPK